MIIHSLLAEVRAAPPGKDKEIPRHVADLLLTSLGFQRHFGFWPGEHFRLEDGKGCFHLRILEGKAYIHRDLNDPRRFLAEHMIETPFLRCVSAAGVLVCAVLVGRLAR